ncbi:hypothetical protein [Capnocytophaga sp.]|uniref:hypothetical protein n=1 Tax=Capnocytophaga sp. TaxID=44737 RepID=UPI0026DB1158|nr:hypothetical protein [Capnocytophaga sp.]MDO5106112.1 hypothetical protein [Capnocytophaga sp.]
MKKLLFIIGIGFTTLLSAQQKPENLTFTHKLTYELGQEQKEIPGTVIAKLLTLYVADKSMILETNNATFLFKDGNLSSVVLGAFDNQVHFLPQSGFEPGLLGFKLTTQAGQISTKNQCTWYKLQLFETNQEDDLIDICQICVDTQNKKDNTSIIAPHNVKGLIKEIQLIGVDYNWTLVKEESINKTFLYDVEAIKTQKQAYDKQLEERYGYQPGDSIEVDPPQTIDMPYHNEAHTQDPLYYPDFRVVDKDLPYNISYYAEGIHSIANDKIYNLKDYGGKELDRKQLIVFLKSQYKSSVKNLVKAKMITKNEGKELDKLFKQLIDKAEKFDPANIPPHKDPPQYINDIAEPTDDAIKQLSETLKYVSMYKNMEIEEHPPLLLNDYQGDETTLSRIPSMCTKYEDKIPAFENPKLTLYMRDYVGQLCDLYLSTHIYLVDVRSTVDSLRKSWLEIEKLRPTLSKQDTEQLAVFLQSLD